jgi:hypothetical protein
VAINWDVLSTLSHCDERLTMHAHAFCQGRVCSPRPLAILYNSFGFLDELVPHVFAGMLGLFCKDCPATISIVTKRGNQSSNWSAMDCSFKQFEYRIVVHLEKGG